jgi:ParB-like nuclease domain
MHGGKMTKLVLLSKIKDNPFRDKKRNPVDKDRVEQLVESIGTTGFWKGIYGREVGEYVEIAFGHTRVDAAREAGLKEIPVEVEKFSDADMLMRMTRENLRGELLVALEAVGAAVRALGDGTVKLDEPDIKTNASVLRYAPSFVPGKTSVTLGVTHSYTADSLAKFLGGVYVKPSGHAQTSVIAALGILEMEERKVTGFSEKTLKTATDEGVRYLGAKKIIQLVNDVKQREVKIIERREKTAEEAADFDKQQRAIQAQRKAVAEKAEEERTKLVSALAKAKVEENKPKIEAIKEKIAEKEQYAVEKQLDLEVRAAELEKKVEKRKAQEAEAKKEDAYLPTKREVERILHKLEGESATTKEALVAEIKALVRQPLNNTDRERLRQAALNYGTWYCEWASQQFLPPLSNAKKLNEYRSREASNRRAAEAKAEKEREKAERKAAKEKKK